jgi:preprotein translocase subunit SecA
MTSSPDIIYSTNHDMIFTYLQSRLERRPFFNDQRFDVVFIDEADNLCIDLGKESVRISKERSPRFPEAIYHAFLEFVDAEQNANLDLLSDEAVKRFRQAASLSSIVDARWRAPRRWPP